MESKGIIRISPEKMNSEFSRILESNGFSADRALVCSEIFTTNSLEGVLSHGVNRFPRFVKNVRDGFVDPSAVPSLVHATGALEQWNGNLGPGPLNAVFATERAMKLAGENTAGIIGMANTNHWMRAGTYGWQAAKKGFVFICWTNTCPNMPAWGAKDPRLGNNPMVIAVPYNDEAIVLDSAMSQFSYGKLETGVLEKKQLPYNGGFDMKGNLTTDPGEILESWRILPAGYWKGAGMSLLLDIVAALLSGGKSVHEVKSCESEHSVSQVFIAIDISKLGNYSSAGKTVENIVADLRKSVPADESSRIRFPGENVIPTREKYRQEGIPVNKSIWEKILSL